MRSALLLVGRSDWPLVEGGNNAVQTSLVEALKTLCVAFQLSAVDPPRFLVQFVAVPAGTGNQFPCVVLRRRGRHGVDENGNVRAVYGAVACVVRLGMRFDNEKVHREGADFERWMLPNARASCKEYNESLRRSRNNSIAPL